MRNLLDDIEVTWTNNENFNRRIKEETKNEIYRRLKIRRSNVRYDYLENAKNYIKNSRE